MLTNGTLWSSVTKTLNLCNVLECLSVHISLQISEVKRQRFQRKYISVLKPTKKKNVLQYLRKLTAQGMHSFCTSVE